MVAFLGSIFAALLSLFTSLPGELLSSNPQPAPVYSQYTSSGASYGDLNHTVLGRVTPGDFDSLARLINAEAGGESMEGQIAVGATVLNRVKSGKFPKTITGVVYQRAWGHYQYTPVWNGNIKRRPSNSAIIAAKRALAGYDPTFGALHFFNPDKTNDAWVHSRKKIRKIGGHWFAV